MLVKTCAVTQRYKRLLVNHTVNLCPESPVYPGYQGLTLRLLVCSKPKGSRLTEHTWLLSPSLQRRHLTPQLLSGPCLHCCQEPLACRTWHSGVPQPLSGTPPCTRVCLLVTTPSQLPPALDRHTHCIGLCQTGSGVALGLMTCSGHTMQQGLALAVA